MHSNQETPHPKEDSDQIVDFLPLDHSRQTDSMSEAVKVLRNGSAYPARFIADLGCGTGSSCKEFSSLGAKVQWIGLDIPDSPEVRQRGMTRLNLCTYDGFRIPIADDRINLILNM